MTTDKPGLKRYIYSVKGARTMKGFTMTIRADDRATADRKAETNAAMFGVKAWAKFIKEI